MPNFRKKRNKVHDWLIDRQIQKTGGAPGIAGNHDPGSCSARADRAIVDHTQEHLCDADLQIKQTQKFLSEADEVAQEGGRPRGVQPSYYAVHAAEQVLEDGTRWRETLRHLYNSNNP